MRNPAELSRTFACLALLSLAVLNCSSEKNYEERSLVAPPKPENCVGACQPDPGSAPVDCVGPEQGLEFLRVWDFQLTATALYSYDDDSTSFRQPLGYEPDTTPFERCGIPDNRALHVYGGPFLGWGGGIGRRLDTLASQASLVGPGGEQTLSCSADPKPDHCPPPEATFEGAPRWIDLSQWEGISFWARRGPDSQAGVRVLIGDKQTDDDIAFLQYYSDPTAPRSCERTKECGCRGKPCSPWPSEGSELPEGVTAPAPGTYCYDPVVDPPPNEVLGTADEYRRCGDTECQHLYEAFQVEDTQFSEKPCSEYAFRGGIVGSYCYDPATGPEPAPSEEQCGDHWMSGVHLSTDWQFYKVPFTDLLQQGWAKEFHTLDIHAVSVLRFTWDRGWIDYWFDDVSFYRRVE